jgi:hypothetical protein
MIGRFLNINVAVRSDVLYTIQEQKDNGRRFSFRAATGKAINKFSVSDVSVSGHP